MVALTNVRRLPAAAGGLSFRVGWLPGLNNCRVEAILNRCLVEAILNRCLVEAILNRCLVEAILNRCLV
jgi:hypothetical protein